MKYRNYILREVRLDEKEKAAEIEQICFPPNEACSPSQMYKRIQKAPELFLVAEDCETGKLAGLLNGLATDDEVFRDEFFENAELYKPDGNNVMLLGLDVLPEYRKQGLAKAMMEYYLERQKEKGRKKAILTCLEDKVPMYKKMGYIDRGFSQSTWGGEQWHEMYYIINE